MHKIVVHQKCSINLVEFQKLVGFMSLNVCIKYPVDTHMTTPCCVTIGTMSNFTHNVNDSFCFLSRFRDNLPARLPCRPWCWRNMAEPHLQITHGRFRLRYLGSQGCRPIVRLDGRFR